MSIKKEENKGIKEKEVLTLDYINSIDPVFIKHKDI